jgi:hypothetical protein
MSGLKIIFDKSEVLLIGGDNDLAMAYAEVFNCNIEMFPIKYLGVPITAGMLRVIDWFKLEEKYVKKNLDIWQGGSMSFGGRITLINASLSNASICRMYIFLLPKTTIDNLDKQRSSFSVRGSLKRKYHLVRWEKKCRDRKKGDLGIKDLRKMNISTLCKWWWMLETQQGLW